MKLYQIGHVANDVLKSAARYFSGIFIDFLISTVTVIIMFISIFITKSSHVKTMSNSEKVTSMLSIIAKLNPITCIVYVI